MAANRRGTAKRTSSDTSATQSSPNAEDVLGRSTSYDDPTESDLEQVMADLMSNDLPFSVRSSKLFGETDVDCGPLGPCSVTSLPQSSGRAATVAQRASPVGTTKKSYRSRVVG